jgi:hypothetical protein
MENELTQEPTINPVAAPVEDKQAEILSKALREYEQEFNSTTKHTETGASTTATPTPTDGVPVVESSNKKSLASLVKGKYAVNLIDLLVPSALVFIVNVIGYKLSKDKLKLDKEERETLTPFVDDFLGSIEFNLSNPTHNLLLALGIVYGSKVIDAVPTIKKAVKNNSTTPEDIQEEREPIEQREDVPSIVLFEQEYNAEVTRIMEEKQKGTLGARKWLADHEPQKIKFLMSKYGVTDDKYLLYSNIYKKEKQAAADADKYQIKL